jgi:hypothetical protein
MLEIILVFAMSKKIAAMAREKGRSAVGYVFLLIGFWFGGEIAGAVIGVVASLAANPNAEPNLAVVYILALFGAAAGAIISFVVVGNLPSVDHYPDERDDDDLDIRIRR